MDEIKIDSSSMSNNNENSCEQRSNNLDIHLENNTQEANIKENDEIEHKHHEECEEVFKKPCDIIIDKTVDVKEDHINNKIEIVNETQEISENLFEQCNKKLNTDLEVNGKPKKNNVENCNKVKGKRSKNTELPATVPQKQPKNIDAGKIEHSKDDKIIQNAVQDVKGKIKPKQKPEKDKARAGTAASGQDNESLVPALFALRLILNPNVDDFTLRGNSNFFGAMDDVIVDMKLINDEEKHFAFQLKHKEDDTKNIQPIALEADEGDGDFCIRKYQNDFFEKLSEENQQKYHIVMYTNAGFDASKTKQLKNYTMTPYNDCPGHDYFNTSDQKSPRKKIKIKGDPKYFQHILAQNMNCNIYKFEKRVSDEKSDKFLSRFSLYVAQKSVRYIKMEIEKIFAEHFNVDKTFATSYTEFFRQWCQNEFTHRELTKSVITLQIINLLLNPYVITPKFHNIDDQKYKIIENSIRNFNITIVDPFKDSQLFWKIPNGLKMNNQQILHLGQTWNFVTRAYQLNEVDEKLKIQVWWYILKGPIVIQINDKNWAIISSVIQHLKVQNLCLILIGGKILEKVCDFKGLHIFENLHQLMTVDPECYRNILEEFQVSIQGRSKIFLKHLMELDADISKIFTINQIITARDDLVIGQDMDILPKFYIDRKVESITFPLGILNEISDKIYIECNEYLPIIIEYFKINQIANYQIIDNDFIDESIKICLVTQPIGQIKFDGNYHQFRLIDGNSLLWVATNGNIDQLLEFKTAKKSKISCIHETEILELYHNPVNVICAVPGVGKSTFINFLKNRTPSHYWAVKINYREVNKFFDNTYKDPTMILDYFLEFTGRNYNEFSRKIRDVFIQKNQLQFFWDGLDELYSDNRIKNALNCIQIIRNNVENSKQWLASRLNLQSLIENELNLFTINLFEINENDQNQYIRSRLDGILPEPNIDAIILRLHNNINAVGNHFILGVPLQLFMITDIFLENPGKSPEFLDEFIILTRMFRSFFQRKCRLHIEKSKPEYSEIMSLPQEDILENRLRKYQAAAIYSYLKPEMLQYLDEVTRQILSDEYGKFINEFHNSGDYLGVIIGINSENFVIFEHNLYAEFCIGLYMAENWKRITEFRHFIFGDNYTNIRLFFDMILAEESPTLLAILYKDIDGINNVNEVDKLGRTAAHIALSWGVYHPPLNCEIIQHKMGGFFRKFWRSLGNVPIYKLKTQPQLDDIMVEKDLVIGRKIAQQLDFEQVDQIFGLSTLDYAKITSPLAVLEGISSRHHLGDLFSIFELSIYCLLYNYESLFKNIVVQLPIFYINYDPYTLYDFAMELTRKNLAELIVKNPKYRQLISNNSTFHQSLKELVKRKPTAGSSHYVSADDEIYEELKTVTNFESYDLDGNTILTLAAELGDYNFFITIVENSSADRNQWNINGLTPLMISKKFKFNNIAQYLGNLKDLKYRGDILRFHAAQGNFKELKLLIETRGFINEINKVNRFGENILFDIVRINRIDIVEYLIQNTEIDYNLYNTKHENVLTIAAAQGFQSIVQYLVNNTKIIIDSIDNFRESPILKAAKNNHYDVVQCLYENNAKIYTVNRNNENLLMFLSIHNKLLLLQDIISKNHIDDLIYQADIRGDTAVLKAVENNNFEIVEFLIDHYQKIDLNQQNSSGSTIFMYACYFGHLKFAEKLITNHKINYNCINNRGECSLSLAASQKHFDIVRYLMTLPKIDIHIVTNFGNTTLTYCAEYGAIDIVEELIRRDANINQVNKPGETALLKAAIRPYYDIMKLLIKHGGFTAINHKNSSEENILFSCARKGNLEIFQLLVETYKMNYNAKNWLGENILFISANCRQFDIMEYLLTLPDIEIDVKSNLGLNPVILVAAKGELSTLQMLLKRYRQHPNIKSMIDASFMNAVKYGRVDVMKYLIQEGASINHSNIDGDNPLMASIIYEQLDLVQLLTERPDIDLKHLNKKGQTALLRAAYTCNKDILKYLINTGNFDIAAKDFQNRTILHTVAASDSIDVDLIRYLINEVDGVLNLINCIDKDGATVLSLCVNLDVEIVKFLIEKGADWHWKSLVYKSNLLILAVRLGKFNIVQYLVNDLKMDVNDVDCNRKTALYWAFINQNHEIIRFLIEGGALVSIRKVPKFLTFLK